MSVSGLSRYLLACSTGIQSNYDFKIDNVGINYFLRGGSGIIGEAELTIDHERRTIVFDRFFPLLDRSDLRGRGFGTRAHTLLLEELIRHYKKRINNYTVVRQPEKVSVAWGERLRKMRIRTTARFLFPEYCERAFQYDAYLEQKCKDSPIKRKLRA